MATHAYPPSGSVPNTGVVGLQNAGGSNAAAPRGNFIPQLWFA